MQGAGTALGGAIHGRCAAHNRCGCSRQLRVTATRASDPRCPVSHVVDLPPQASCCHQQATRGLATRQLSGSAGVNRCVLTALKYILLDSRGMEAASTLSKHSLCLFKMLTAGLSTTQVVREAPGKRALPAGRNQRSFAGEAVWGQAFKDGSAEERRRWGSPGYRAGRDKCPETQW